MPASADWAAWHLPGGPVGSPAWWAATSNREVGQMRSTVGLLIPKCKFKVLSKLPVGLSGHLALLLIGLVCLVSQGWFEEPVRPFHSIEVSNKRLGNFLCPLSHPVVMGGGWIFFSSLFCFNLNFKVLQFQLI